MKLKIDTTNLTQEQAADVLKTVAKAELAWCNIAKAVGSIVGGVCFCMLVYACAGGFQ